MGHNRRHRVLADAARYQANFALTCRRCGREVVIERDSFVEIAAAWRLGSDVERIAARLRCTACGHRGGILELAPPDAPGVLRLHDGSRLPPRGVSLSAWLRLSESARKRYLRGDSG